MGAGQKPKTEEQIIEKTAEYVTKKLDQKRRKVKNNMSAELSCTASQSEVIEMVQKAFILFKRPHADTDEKIAESFDWYFQEYLPATGAFPTVEGLAAACGVDTDTLQSWTDGRCKSSLERLVMTKKAKQILAELDAQLVQAGKIPQVTYIFRAKNYHGLQDSVKVEHITQKETVQSAEELDRKYRDAVVVDYKPAEDDNETAEQADSDPDSGAPDEPES